MEKQRPGECAQNCYNCGAACPPEDGEKRKPSFFDRLEAASEHFEEMGEENFIRMLDEAVATLEAEEAAEEEEKEDPVKSTAKGSKEKPE